MTSSTTTRRDDIIREIERLATRYGIEMLLPSAADRAGLETYDFDTRTESRDRFVESRDEAGHLGATLERVEFEVVNERFWVTDGLGISHIFSPDAPEVLPETWTVVSALSGDGVSAAYSTLGAAMGRLVKLIFED